MKFISMFLLCPLALSPLTFTSIGNTDICTNSVWKSWYFEFSRISRRYRVGWGKKSELFRYFFFFACHCAVVSPSSVQVLTRLSGGARPFGSLIRFWLAHVRRELSLFTQACNGCIAATVSSSSSDRYTYPRYDKLYRYYYAYANRRHTT